MAYSAVALAGIIDGSDVFGLIGADIADKTFHTVIGLAAISSALASRPEPKRVAPA